LVKDAVRKLISINIDDKYKKEFEEELTAENILRGKILSIILIIIELVVISVSIINEPVFILLSRKGIYYLMYLLLITVMTVLLLFMNHYSKKIDKNIRHTNAMTYFAAAFIL